MQRPSKVVRFLRQGALLEVLLVLVLVAGVVRRRGQGPILVEAVEEPLVVVVPLDDVVLTVDGLGAAADSVSEPKLEQRTARGPVGVVVEELLAALGAADAGSQHDPRSNLRIVLVELERRPEHAANLALLRLGTVVEQVQPRAQPHLAILADVGKREGPRQHRGPRPAKRLFTRVLISRAFALLTRRGGDVDPGPARDCAPELTGHPKRRVRVVQPREHLVVHGIRQRDPLASAIRKPAPLKRVQLVLGPLDERVHLPREQVDVRLPVRVVRGGSRGEAALVHDPERQQSRL